VARVFKTLFVGNSAAYGLQDENGKWHSIKKRVTLDLIVRHLKRELTIGSYNVHKANGLEYCSWLCVDIDKHGGDAVANADEIVPEVAAYLIAIYSLPEESVLVEDSGGGYHVWLFLSPKTTLKRAFSLKEDVEWRLKEKFGIACEVFPKQDSLEGTRGFGNFVKLPFSLNRKPYCAACSAWGGDDAPSCPHYRLDPAVKARRDEQGKPYPEPEARICASFVRAREMVSVPVFPFDAFKAVRFDIKPLVSRLRRQDRKERDTERKRHERGSEAKVDLTKWRAWNYGEAEEFYRKMRPCTREIVLGKDATGSYGHQMRIQVANELFKLHAPLEVRVRAFAAQKDFDPGVTRYQCEDLERRCRAKNRFFLARCSTIQKQGYCVPWCYKRGVTVSKQKFLSEKKERRNGVTGGWDELQRVVGKCMDEAKKVYFEKTTRAGVSWTVITEGLKRGKKMLIVGPTIRMAEEMVTEAMAKSGVEARLFRFGSIQELCNLVSRKIVDVPVLANFPFFVKGNCRECGENCLMREAEENIKHYDVIYTTIAKLNAFIKTKDEVNKKILDGILEHIDLIFVDEVSHIIEVGSEGFEFLSVADGIYTRKLPSVSASREFEKQYRDFLDSGILNRLEVGRGLVRNIFKACRSMIRNVSKRLETGFVSEARFVKCASEVHAQLLENDAYHESEKEENARHYGSGVIDWLKAYKALQDYASETGRYPAILVRVLLVGKYEHYYVQATTPLKYERKVDIYPAVPVKRLLDFVERLSERKTFFCTDATEPPIPPENLFSNLDRVFIDDPMGTSRKQTVFCDFKHRSMSHARAHLPDLERFLTSYCNDQTFVVAQSMVVAAEVRKLMRKRKIRKRVLTYFRSPHTIGVASDLRRMITVGSPHPPKNCYMWLADLYRKEGLVDMELIELGKKLEYYNAKNTFFQAISRVKDPNARSPSEVYCFGLTRDKLKSLLNFVISTPRVEYAPLKY